MKRNIVEIVQAMERSVGSRGSERVFRGEPACFEKVSSGLFRTYGLEKGEGDFNVETVEDEMVKAARSFTDRKDSFEILCEIQHRGGSTNQMDFTRDLGVALFFACGTASGRELEPGRVIMLDDSDAAREAGVSIRDITHPIHMAAAQKSVFVSTDSGYLDDRHLPHVQMWTIDADKKQEVLEYLKSSRGIDSRSIFMDISGFIRNTHEFESATAWFYRGQKMFLQGDFDGAIEAASNHLRLVGRGFASRPGLHLRGQAYYRKGDRIRAFRDLRRTQGVKRVMKRRAAKLLGWLGPTEWPAYPLPDDVQKELAEWCKEQSRIEEEARRQERTQTQARRRENELRGGNLSNRMLQSIISASHATGTSDSPILMFDVLTDTGYSYRQNFAQGSEVMMSWPPALLDCEAACWWSFHGAEHQHIVVARKTVPEDIEVILRPKPGSSATPSTVKVRFFAYDANKQKLKKKDSGEYGLVARTRTE